MRGFGCFLVFGCRFEVVDVKYWIVMCHCQFDLLLSLSPSTCDIFISIVFFVISTQSGLSYSEVIQSILKNLHCEAP